MAQRFVMVVVLLGGCSDPVDVPKQQPSQTTAASETTATTSETVPCWRRFRPTRSTPSRSELTAELVAACPSSSMAHVLKAFNALTEGDDAGAHAAFTRAIELDTEWDEGSEQHARLLHSILAARLSAAPREGLRMAAVSHRQVMAIPGVTAGYIGGGVSPSVDAAFGNWVDMTTGIVNIAVTQGSHGDGSGVIVIPGITTLSPQGSSQRPFITVIQEHMPPPVGVVPVGGTVGDAEAECRRHADARCRAEHDRIGKELFDCCEDCVRTHRGDPQAIDACTWRCDAAFQEKKKSVERNCETDRAACAPSVASEHTQPPIGLRFPGGSVAESSESCATYTDCLSCAQSTQCGWCAATARCVGGTPAASSECTSGWQPFPESCADPCVNETSCSACTRFECGWCVENSTCYAGTPVSPGTGVCQDGWRPFPAMCD